MSPFDLSSVCDPSLWYEAVFLFAFRRLLRITAVLSSFFALRRVLRFNMNTSFFSFFVIFALIRYETLYFALHRRFFFFSFIIFFFALIRVLCPGFPPLVVSEKINLLSSARGFQENIPFILFRHLRETIPSILFSISPGKYPFYPFLVISRKLSHLSSSRALRENIPFILFPSSQNLIGI